MTISLHSVSTVSIHLHLTLHVDSHSGRRFYLVSNMSFYVFVLCIIIALYLNKNYLSVKYLWVMRRAAAKVLGGPSLSTSSMLQS